MNSQERNHRITTSIRLALPVAVLTALSLGATNVCEAKKPHSETSSDSPKLKQDSKNSKSKDKAEKMTQIYEFHAKTLDGNDVSFDQYKGDVLLIVNTASECGFTPQYQGLEELHKKYGAKGLKVLGFPCNQFGHQEPGDSTQIATFCKKNFGVDFQMFEKVDVNGKNAHPLYKYLTSAAPGALGTEGIKWNFTKFLIDRKGNVLKRYAPNVKPEEIATDIEKQL